MDRRNEDSQRAGMPPDGVGGARVSSLISSINEVRDMDVSEERRLSMQATTKAIGTTTPRVSSGWVFCVK